MAYVLQLITVIKQFAETIPLIFAAALPIILFLDKYLGKTWRFSIVRWLYRVGFRKRVDLMPDIKEWQSVVSNMGLANSRSFKKLLERSDVEISARMPGPNGSVREIYLLVPQGR